MMNQKTNATVSLASFYTNGKPSVPFLSLSKLGNGHLHF